MNTEPYTLEDISDIALKEAARWKCNDVAITCSRANDFQVRFANNNITLVNNVRNLSVDVYIAREHKRVIGTTYNPTDNGLKIFIEHLIKSCDALPPSKDYVGLPEGSLENKGHSNFDSRVVDSNLVDYAKQAIDSALSAGALRVSGSLKSEISEIYLATSTGVRGRDKSSQLLLNVRAFRDDNASGQGLACSSYVSNFDVCKAGERAGSYAERALNPVQIPEGVYSVIFTPTVISNILPVASNASAFAIETGNSFLNDKLETKVAVDALDVTDYGVYDHGLGGRIFDDEGSPTRKNEILSNGVFRTMLHNSTTAKKFGKTSTGNAGIIVPKPFTIVFGGGDSTFEEMIRETKNGLLVTNNWYTRFQNVRAGEYSTVPRDAAFKVENGEVKEPVSGLRISDSIPRQLENVDLISKEREWIRWWEVETPTFAPAMRIKGVHVTRAVGS
ncbi:MAG: TldD/PmbA family protein [Nitrososphaerota archaeon]|nr:TldD/PmbA family protein [Nitrososphaerota archaeon]